MTGYSSHCNDSVFRAVFDIRLFVILSHSKIFTKYSKKLSYQIDHLDLPNLLQKNSLNPATSFKKRLRHRCFLMSFAKFLRVNFVTEPLWWLLLSFNEKRNITKNKVWSIQPSNTSIYFFLSFQFIFYVKFSLPSYLCFNINILALLIHDL